MAGSLALAVVAAAHGEVHTFPREGWANAVISRTDNGWRVQAGPQVMNVSVQSKDKSLGDRLKLSIAGGALSIDAAELMAAGAGVRLTCPIKLGTVDGQDVLVASVWSGTRGSQCSLLLEGQDKNGRHWWRSGKISPSGRPRTFRHAFTIAEGMRELHYRLDLNSVKGPVLLHKLQIGPYWEMASDPPPRGKPEPLFHAPFDGNAKASFARGDPAPCKEAGLEYVPGRRGKAVRLSPALKSTLAYNLKGNLNPAGGTIAFWFKHEWKETKKLGNRDDNGKDIWRYVLSAPAENAHAGDGSLKLWWWGGALRMDRGDLDSGYSGFWHAKPDDAWRHYVVVWDDYGARLYCDGKGNGADDIWSPMREALAVRDPLEFDRDLSAFKTFFVGSAKDGTWQIEGLVDDLRIWSAPMSREEVQKLYLGEQDAALTPDAYYGTEGVEKSIRVSVRGISKKLPSGLRARLLDASGKVVAVGSPVRKGVSTISAALPKGEYSLALSDGILACPVPYWVLGRGNPVEAPPRGTAGVAPDMKLLYTVTPDLATLSPDKFRAVGKCRMGELGGVKYLEAGARRNDRFALRLHFETNTPLHCIEIDYPDDGSRTMDIIVQRSRNEYSDYTMQVGRYGGLEVPTSGKMLTHRCLYWTTAEDATLIAMTARADSPAAIAAVRVYAVESGALPSTPVLGGGGRAGERRHLGSYWEDPSINSDYGVNSATAGSLDTLIDRKAAYMKFLGEDTFAYPGCFYQGLVAHDTYNPRSHSRHFLQAWCEKFDREGLRVVPTVNQQTIPFKDGVVTRKTMSDGSLHPTAIAIHDTGKPNWGGWHGTPPYFCILHPDVRRELMRVVDALVADGAGHPSFAGICFHLANVNWLWWGSIESGYNDYCIDAFERATGVKVPVDRKDPMRGKAYAQWLKANAYEKWVQWRCDVLTGIYSAVAKRLAAARPDLKLWLNACPSYRMTSPDYTAPGYFERFLREAGLDAAGLQRRIPNIVIGQTLAPCNRRKLVADLPLSSEQKERVDAVMDSADYYPLFRPASSAWLNLHDWYWENPVGRDAGTERLSCEWLNEMPWRVSTLQASGRNAMKYYAVPFLHNDIQGISCGGFLEGTYGMEDMMAAFAQAFRALPAVKFPTIAEKGKVVLRGARAEGRSWFYVVNADGMPASVEVAVPAKTVDLVTRKRIGAAEGMRRVAIRLEPYEFRSYAAPEGLPSAVFKSER